MLFDEIDADIGIQHPQERGVSAPVILLSGDGRVVSM